MSNLSLKQMMELSQLYTDANNFYNNSKWTDITDQNKINEFANLLTRGAKTAVGKGKCKCKGISKCGGFLNGLDIMKPAMPCIATQRWNPKTGRCEMPNHNYNPPRFGLQPPSQPRCMAIGCNGEFDNNNGFQNYALGSGRRRKGGVSCRAMTANCHRGSGPMPSERTFFDLVRQSYKQPAIDTLDGFQKVYDIPEVKAYVNNDQKTVLIAYRGTQAERGDLAADAMIAVNNLSRSERYSIDYSATQKILESYPSPPYDYYLTGHSLGGAIVTQIKRDFPQLKGAVVFNSANQPYDLVNQQSDVKKMYIDLDPLYNLGGQTIVNKEVLPFRTTTLGKYTDIIRNGLAGINPITGVANTAYKAKLAVDAHALKNFTQKYGGRKHRGGFVHTKGMNPSEIQRY